MPLLLDRLLVTSFGYCEFTTDLDDFGTSPFQYCHVFTFHVCLSSSSRKLRETLFFTKRHLSVLKRFRLLYHQMSHNFSEVFKQLVSNGKATLVMKTDPVDQPVNHVHFSDLCVLM